MRFSYARFRPKFKREMSSVEIYGIEAILREMFEDKIFLFHTDALGLAYTSSSLYAALNVCNGEFLYEGAIISRFAILEDGRLVMVCTDGDERKRYCIAEG